MPPLDPLLREPLDRELPLDPLERELLDRERELPLDPEDELLRAPLPLDPLRERDVLPELRELLPLVVLRERDVPEPDELADFLVPDDFARLEEPDDFVPDDFDRLDEPDDFDRDDEPDERELVERDDDERDEDDDRRFDPLFCGLRSAAGTSVLMTSRTICGICFSMNFCIRSSWRRYSFASFTVSLSPSWSATASIVV